MPEKLERYTVYACVLIGLWSAWLHFFSPLDGYWQNFFFVDGHWLVDENEPILKWLLYKGPKIICTIVGVAAAVRLAMHFWFKKPLNGQRVAGLLTFVITIAVYPTLIALLKDLIRQPCPRDLVQYGGAYGGSLTDFFLNRGDILCFPGAHASAPFSFLALAFVFTDRANRALFLFVVLPLAFFIGFYQVAKGAHFVSDTICTAAFSWVFISLVHGAVLRIRRRPKLSRTSHPV